MQDVKTMFPTMKGVARLRPYLTRIALTKNKDFINQDTISCVAFRM